MDQDILHERQGVYTQPSPNMLAGKQGEKATEMERWWTMLVYHTCIPSLGHALRTQWPHTRSPDCMGCDPVYFADISRHRSCTDRRD